MAESTVTTFYYVYSKEEADEIKEAIDKAREQDNGKIRQGDALRMILLNWARNGGKI
jgi:hypothetical protein